MNHSPGLTLYRALLLCAQEGKDAEKLKRIENRLDTYQSGLTGPQNAEFLAILISSGLIPVESELGRAIVMFGGQKVGRSGRFAEAKSPDEKK